MTSYCKNCGTELPDGAHFCASCGTPVQTYINMHPGGNMQAGNCAAEYPDGAQAVHGQGVNAIPYAPGNPNGAAYQNASAYQDAPAYQNTSAYGRELQIYAEGQTYGSGQPEYGQAYGNDAEMYAAGGSYAGNPYDPYGKAVQPQSGRRALMIMGMIIGLAAVIAVILLIVLLTRDKGHRTYQQVVGIFMDGLEEQSLGKLSEAFPERVREDMRRGMFGTLRQEYGESASDFYVESDFWTALNEALDWYCGEDVTMSYTITSQEPIADYRLREYERKFLEDFHYTVSFGSGYVVKIEIVYRGSEGGYTSTLNLKTAEIDEKWYVIDSAYD